MDKIRVLRRAHKAVSFALMLKGFAGFSIAALALFGAVVPHFGVEPNHVAQGGVATVAGLFGAFLASRV